MKIRAIIAVAALSIAGTGQAQNSTTRCQWLGGVYTCQTQEQPRNGVDWGLMNTQPNHTDNIMEGFMRGQQARQEQEVARANQAIMNERARAAKFDADCKAEMMAAVRAEDYEKAKLIASVCG